MSSEQSNGKRDGFAVCKFDGAEVHFVPCTYSGRHRDMVLSGLLRQSDTDRFYVKDTRDVDA